MIITPTLPGGYAIFCDDIREEVSGKFTFCGTYSGELTIFGVSPAKLAKLCVATRFRVDPTALPIHVVFQITRDTEQGCEILLEAPFNAPAPPPEFQFPESIGNDSVKFVEVGFNAELVELVFSNVSTIRVKALLGDDEYRLGAVTVKVSEPVVPVEPKE